LSDFRAHIVGNLDLSEARSQMESFLNEYKDKKLKITPEINTSQAQKAGEQVAQAVSKGMEKSAQSTGAQFAQAVSKGASKSKKGKDLFGFSEEQQKVRKKIAKDAELLQESYPGLNKKDAKKDARGYYTAQESERKKADQAAQKASEQKMKDSISAINEESKARERAEKQNYQTRKKNADAIMKESLANIEKQSKNKADIIKAQASGKDSTVDVLKEQRKQLRSEGRKLQKEMRSYNDIYSPSERSQILRNKRMESSYDVDMARAAVSDKVAASLKVSSSGSASSSNSTKSGNNKIRYNVETGNYAARSSKMEKQLSVYSGQDTENVAKATIALKTYNEELGNLQNHFNGSKRMNGSELAASFERMTKAGDTFKNTLSQINDTQSKNLATGVAERGANKIAAYYEANSKAVKKYGASLKELESQYRNAKTVEDKGNIENEFSTLKSRISAEGLTGKSGLDEAKRAFKQIGQFAMTYGLIQNTVMQIPSQMISAVKDYDSAMTNMQMATGISNNQAQELMNTYSDMGKQLKVTGVDVATSATEWMKQGKTIEESNKLAQDSIVLSKIGDLSSDDATRTITAAMKSYDLNESQVMDFVDQISAIDMASGTDVGGLANAFNEVAANANQAGISTKQLLSYAAVIGETTQEGMSSVGTSLNAIFSRMGNIKLSRLKDYQNGGEDLSNVETVLKGVGISLRDTDGEFKNFGDVLDDTAARWSDFGTVQQRAVAQAFAGTNHMNDFMVLMQQYSKAQEYMQTASDASGTSMEKYGAYTDSFEGKLEGLKSTFESLSNTVVNSDFLKGTIDTGTQALEIFDKVTNSLGVINTAAIGLGIFQGKNNSGESTWDSPHAFFKTTYAA
jgi:TP901 family phage tail tape measure protein